MPIVFGLLTLLAFLLFQVSTRARSEARLSHMLGVGAELLYRAEAPVAQVIRRLLVRPWEVRFYATGPAFDGPFAHTETGQYRGGDYALWVQDVELASTRVAPGMSDLFVRLDYEGRRRQYHYRISFHPSTSTQERRVTVEFFEAEGGDLTSAGDRQRASAEATALMVEAETNRAETRALTSLQPTADDAAAEADRRLGVDLAGAAARSQEAEALLQRGIHLMGEVGEGLQRVLPPLQRRRFLSRSPADEAAAESLEQAMAKAGDDLQIYLTAGLALARLRLAEAWRTGPASEQGAQLIDEAWDLLAQLIAAYQAAPEKVRQGLDPSLFASLLFTRVRAAAMGRNGERLEPAVAEAEGAATQGRIYGGMVDIEVALERLMGRLRSPAYELRTHAGEALPPSGFEPVTADEVDGFLADSESGWSDWPEDSGKGEAWWRERWEHLRERLGEGGTGEPVGDIDTDGDGVPDTTSTDEPPPDTDGDGIPDDHPLVDGALVCGEGCGEAFGAERFRCMDVCLDDAEPVITEYPDVPTGQAPDPTAVAGALVEEAHGFDVDTEVAVQIRLSTSYASSMELAIQDEDGNEHPIMTWVRQDGDDLSPLYVNGEPVQDSMASHAWDYAHPLETRHSLKLKAGERLITRKRGEPLYDSVLSVIPVATYQGGSEDEGEDENEGEDEDAGIASEDEKAFHLFPRRHLMPLPRPKF